VADPPAVVVAIIAGSATAGVPSYTGQPPDVFIASDDEVAQKSVK
jgi:hypothetical protein